jgi:hypothetical protein
VLRVACFLSDCSPKGPGFCSSAVGNLIFFYVKTNLGFGFGRRRSHELTDGFEEGADGSFMALDALFEFRQLVGKLGVTAENPAELNEGANDSDVDLNGALATQHAGEHADALLLKRAGNMTPSAATL